MPRRAGLILEPVEDERCRVCPDQHGLLIDRREFGPEVAVFEQVGKAHHRNVDANLEP